MTEWIVSYKKAIPAQEKDELPNFVHIKAS